MIYLITNCTNAKKKITNLECKLRNFDFNDINQTANNWINKLSNSNDEKLPIKEMYKGVAWKAGLDAEKSFSDKFNTKLLIASAGYGLVNSCKEIISYSVTFAKNQEDSVYNFDLEMPTKTWWNSINNFDINTIDAKSYIFVSVPYEYLIAMKDTIDDLIKNFGNKVFIIVVSKKVLPKSFDGNILRFDTKFNNFEAGTMTTIIQRCLRWLSNEIVSKELSFEHKVLQNHIDTFLSQYSEYKVEKRIQGSDEELVLLIKEHISNHEIKSASKGLRKLRDMGYACEQKRYGQLFKKTYSEMKSNG